MTQATFFKTVAGWKAVYRNLESFPHPKLCVQCGKGPLPRLLEIHPDAKDQITSLGVKKLATCTKEGIHDYIVRTFIPRLASVWQEDQKVATTKNTSSASIARRPATNTSIDGNIETPVDSICQGEGNQELTSAFLKAH
jgi:hypothetical protein